MRNPVWKRFAIFLLTTVFLAVPEAFETNTATVYWEGDPEIKRIAITVDDCRNVRVMTEMLDLFQANGVKATFYVIGRNLRVKDREFWQRVLAEGHEIGNHTYGHVSLNKRTEKDVKSQMHKTQAALNEILGFEYPLHTMRSPYGNWRGSRTLLHIYRAGYDKVILWSVSQTDPDIAWRQIKNGSVCLFHSNYKDLRCLEILIPQIREDGFEMVTVSELFGFGPEREFSNALIL